MVPSEEGLGLIGEWLADCLWIPGEKPPGIQGAKRKGNMQVENRCL